MTIEERGDSFGTTIVKPQITFGMVSKNQPTTVFKNQKTMFLGRKTADQIYRILFKLPLDIIPENVQILKAILILYIQYAGNNQASEFTPYALVDDWSISSLTWNNQPSFDINEEGESIIITKSGYYRFNLTNLVQKWYENILPNYGVIVKGSELINNRLKVMTSTINSCISPRLEITYTSRVHCRCSCENTRFIEQVEEINTSEAYSYSSGIDTSLSKEITFFIENFGMNTIAAKIQISPDNINYIDDPQNVQLTGGMLTPIVPYYFSRYARIAAVNIHPGETSAIRIWYLAQE